MLIEGLLAERHKKKKVPENINCDIIFVSVAENERIRSICMYIMSDNRHSMTLQLFEATLFLAKTSVSGTLISLRKLSTARRSIRICFKTCWS